MSENVYSTTPEKGFIAPFAADEDSPCIFISYAHDDRDRVFPIIKRLYEQGWKIWYDDGIPLASNYHNVIADHIADCALFLMFVTQSACERPYVIDNEVDYAIRKKSREQIMLCFLEKDIVMPNGAEMLLGGVDRPKYRSVEESELLSVLPKVEWLTCGKPRVAKAITKTGDPVLTDDGGEYLFEKCSGGVRLTRYLGSDIDVEVPAEYPAGSGQKVVELRRTFAGNATVRTIRLPAAVKSIEGWTFDGCTSLTDVYIPSSVTYLDSVFGLYAPKGCKIHCAKGSAAHDYNKKRDIAYIYTQKREIAYVIDDSLAVTDDSATDTAQTAYAYISYSTDMNERAAEIIGAIEKRNGVVCDGSRMVSTEEILEAVNECSCFIFLVSRGYLAGKDIQFFRMASKMNKPKLLYVLEACELPPDLSIENDSQQQLRYDSLNEEQRMAKLVDWLHKNGCRRVSADIPDFEYSATKEDGITLTKYIGSGGEMVIEQAYGGLPVTSIGDSAFSRCSSLTDIAIPDSVTWIGDLAFSGCSSLTGITIPDSVTNIGSSAFSYCTSLTGIAIPVNVASIGRSAFEGCISLTGITIPDSVTSIGFGAFYNCSSLTGISVPDSVTSIGRSAFSGCSSLTDITIPDSVTSIGDRAFSDCSSLTVRCSENSFAWQYCEENGIRHEPPVTSELATHKESAPTPRKKSSARWLVPALILLALAAAAGLQLSGLVDILGLLGL